MACAVILRPLVCMCSRKVDTAFAESPANALLSGAKLSFVAVGKCRLRERGPRIRSHNEHELFCIIFYHQIIFLLKKCQILKLFTLFGNAFMQLSLSFSLLWLNLFSIAEQNESEYLMRPHEMGGMECAMRGELFIQHWFNVCHAARPGFISVYRTPYHSDNAA